MSTVDNLLKDTNLFVQCLHGYVTYLLKFYKTGSSVHKFLFAKEWSCDDMSIHPFIRLKCGLGKKVFNLSIYGYS